MINPLTAVFRLLRVGSVILVASFSVRRVKEDPRARALWQQRQMVRLLNVLKIKFVRGCSINNPYGIVNVSMY